VRRRDFTTLLGGALVWPLSALAQQADRVRRIGVLMTLGADDPIAKARVAAFVERLQQLGWREGANLEIDIRWNVHDPDRRRRDVAELVAVAPDVILATGSITVGPLLQASRSLPIVFVIVPDPVGAGFVETLARPGGNATGFLQFEYSLSGKWVELLKEIAPGITRVAVLRDPSLTAGVAQFAAMQGVAPSVRIELIPLNVGDAAGIERAIASFAHSANAGLIVTSGPVTAVHRDLIIKLASRYRLPAFWPKPEA
jgi:putative tryptophan/tyrosine transport system substrate-binding protein